jgi:hypothetical protein
MTFRSGATDSMPERLHITQQIELRKKQQAEADQKAKAEQSALKQTSQR